jgi:molecular chaperone DnaK
VLADRFWKETGVDLRNRAVEWQALLFACEHAKRILSDKSAAEVRVENLLHTSKGSKGLRYKLSRKEFNGVTQNLIDKSIAIAEKVMSQARISPQQVDAVVLTGGTSLIPAVREAVAKYFRKKPVAGDADLAVVRGAALRAAELGGEAVAETSLGGRTLREVAGRTIGAGPKGGPVVTLFERDTPLPAEIFKAFHTQFDGQTEMVVGLYEESKSRVDESRTIGHLRYKGLRPAPAGESRIDFTFYLDEDGILHVTAVVEGKEYTKSIRLE